VENPYIASDVQQDEKRGRYTKKPPRRLQSGRIIVVSESGETRTHAQQPAAAADHRGRG